MRHALAATAALALLTACSGGVPHAMLPAASAARSPLTSGSTGVSAAAVAGGLTCEHGVVTSVGPYAFNAGLVPANERLWVSAVASFSGVPADAPTTVRFVGVTYRTTLRSGASMTFAMPDAQITFDPHAGAPSLRYVNGAWYETVPASAHGNVVLDAFAATSAASYAPHSGTISGTLCADRAGAVVAWKFGAALYDTRFDLAYGDDGVKPADAYGDGDHAGTPENAKSAFVGGAGSGGGGSNWTGSYSATGHAAIPPPCGC